MALDLDGKMFLPTQELLNRINDNFMSVYEGSRAAAVQFGNDFYSDPIAVMGVVKEGALANGEAFYATVNNDILPAVKLGYSVLNESMFAYGQKTASSLEYFSANPEEVTYAVFLQLNDTMLIGLNKLGSISQAGLEIIAQKAMMVLDYLLVAPLTAVSDAVLGGFLDSYFLAISSLLAIA